MPPIVNKRDPRYRGQPTTTESEGNVDDMLLIFDALSTLSSACEAIRAAESHEELLAARSAWNRERDQFDNLLAILDLPADFRRTAKNTAHLKGLVAATNLKARLTC